MATGYFRRQQADKLSQLLQDLGRQNLCRVVLIHHPPNADATQNYKRLIGSELFRDVIREHGAELVLHGHAHLATRNHLEGKTGKVPVICVPAAGQGPGHRKPAARYNLFEISRNKDKWVIRMSEYGFDAASSAIKHIADHDLTG